MIVYDAFDAKLVGTPLGHAAILERRNKEDAQSVVSVVRRALRWTRRVEDAKAPHIRPEKFSSNRARKSNPRVGFGSLPAVARATGFGSRGRVRTSRKNCLDLAFASGSDAENTGAPAGALRPWLIASRATVARSAMFLSVCQGPLPRERQSRARPWRGGRRDCNVRCRANDTNPSPNPRARAMRRVAGRCLPSDAGARGENENRAGMGIRSDEPRGFANRKKSAKRCGARATQRGARPTTRPTRHPRAVRPRKRWRLRSRAPSPQADGTTEVERAFPRRASSASQAR